MAGDARQQRLDTLGLAISAICLVHCLALPVLALLIPAATFGFGAQTDHALHWVLLGFAAPISTWALWRGATRSHDGRWLKLGSVGLVVMLIGVMNLFGADSEVPLTMIGVVMLTLAHIRNFALSHRHRHVNS